VDRYRVYIVEDHEWLRESLAEYVARIPGVEVCGTAATGEAALLELDSVGADMALVDLTLPQMDGLDVIRLVREARPEIACLVLSAHSDGKYVDAARHAGAVGYVRKDDPEELHRALQAIRAGESYFSSSLPGAD
jgi:DNA-binding NarL/FixJ family response regulator